MAEDSSVDGLGCQCDDRFRSACYGEVAYQYEDNKHYCILHLPSENKVDSFKKAVQRKLECNDFGFAGVYFPIGFGELDLAPYRKFSEHVDFREATLSQGADFFGATFCKGVDFSGARFGEKTNFFRTTFTEKADFSGAKFGEKATFASAIFSEGVFAKAKFGEADFSRAKFGEEAVFIYAKFSGRAGFSGAIFSHVAPFHYAAFSGGRTSPKPSCGRR